MILNHSKLLLAKNITFDEFARLNQKKESIDTASIDYDVSKQVELDVEAPRSVINTPIQPNKRQIQDIVQDDMLSQQQQYGIATSRERRQVRPLS